MRVLAKGPCVQMHFMHIRNHLAVFKISQLLHFQIDNFLTADNRLNNFNQAELIKLFLSTIFLNNATKKLYKSNENSNAKRKTAPQTKIEYFFLRYPKIINTFFSCDQQPQKLL